MGNSSSSNTNRVQYNYTSTQSNTVSPTSANSGNDRILNLRSIDRQQTRTTITRESAERNSTRSANNYFGSQQQQQQARSILQQPSSSYNIRPATSNSNVQQRINSINTSSSSSVINSHNHNLSVLRSLSQIQPTTTVLSYQLPKDKIITVPIPNVQIRNPPFTTNVRVFETTVTKNDPIPTAPSRPSLNSLNINKKRNNANNDCHFYFFGGCRKGGKCTFRHSEAALNTVRVCDEWKSDDCVQWSACPLRHMNEAEILLIGSKSKHGARNPKENDCRDYLNNKCGRARCKYRHCPDALRTTIVCPQWRNGHCLSQTCQLLHSEKKALGLNKNESRNKKTNREKNSDGELENKCSIECCVCLENIEEIKANNKKITSIGCGHLLCDMCANSIVNSVRKECPQCRKRITQEPLVLFF